MLIKVEWSIVISEGWDVLYCLFYVFISRGRYDINCHISCWSRRSMRFRPNCTATKPQFRGNQILCGYSQIEFQKLVEHQIQLKSWYTPHNWTLLASLLEKCILLYCIGSILSRCWIIEIFNLRHYSIVRGVAPRRHWFHSLDQLQGDNLSF